MEKPKSPGPVHPSVARYMKGIDERAKESGESMRKSEGKMPDLSKAAVQFDPNKDGPMTLGQIAQAQENQDAVARGEGGAPTIKPETLAGLAEIKKMADAQSGMSGLSSSSEADDVSPDVVEKTEPLALTNEDESAALADGISDLDIEMMLNRMQQDIIQNKEQQDAIKKKVKPIDFGEGILTGEFSQVVPIREGLVIKYRTLTPFENEEIRKMILEMQLQDPRTARLAAERLSFMQTVAAIVLVNGQEMPKHLKKNPSGWEFDKGTFLKKYNVFANYPTAFIHSLTSHAYWFDQRVREMFTVEAAKNS